jgi:glutamyl-tRNA synthetase
MSVTLRFAPSPTGRLHAGNIRTALLNWMFAQQRGGRLLLRLDDTDRERSTEEFADGIREDLTWLGLAWDREVKQSDRFAIYDAAVEKLKASGRLYPAYETQDELELKRKRQLARGRPPVYDRAALKLTDADREKLESAGQTPHWRFKLETRDVVWNDLIRGEQHVDAASLSDPVLVRADGTYLYTLPSVVDDIDLGITHVVRGEDHVTNTAVQIQLFEALDAAPPRFAHHNLLTLPTGEGLSKRLGHLSLAALREEGYEPSAVAALAVLIGTSHMVEPVTGLNDLFGKVDLAEVSHSAAKFDPAELDALNARTLHMLPFDSVASRLAVLGIEGDAGFWEAVRGNLTRLREAQDWWRVVAGDETFATDDSALIRVASEHLPDEPWDGETWGRWTKAVAAATGKKGRALFHPLRLALTGREQGPELKTLLPLMGRARALRRLTAAG